ncbi:MAG: hypothetical protein WD740_01670 [Anaerolineales bacterium]
MSLEHKITGLVFISVLVTSCNPTLSHEQIQATARVLVADQISRELTSAPSITSAPSATPTLPHTSTPIPSETIDASPTSEPTPQPTWTPFGQMNALDFATAKADKADRNAPLVLDNRSGETVKFIITSPVYQEYEFNTNMTIIVHEATYTFKSWIGEKGPINGSFTITNGDKHVLSFYEGKVVFKIP